MRFLKKYWSTLLLTLMLVIGLCLVLYPSVSDYWNSFHQTRAIAHYSEVVANISNEEYKQMLQEATEYNKKLQANAGRWLPTSEDTDEYNRLLNINNTGIMGYIEIDKINCSLPIYHGTSEGVLQIAIGHLEGTSLPVGGKGTHCVLSGHRGLPSAKLFSNLDELVVGDVFVIRTLDEILTYEVDQILIVEPEDVSALDIEKDEDLCTLVTCTPYGINTHRLLVRGHRVDNLAKAAKIRVTSDATQIEPIIVAPMVAIPILLILILIVLLAPSENGRKKFHKRGDSGKDRK